MWTRKELKARGKLAMKANYLKCVVAAFLLSIVTAGQARATGSSGSNSESISQMLQEASASTGVPVGVFVAIISGIVGVGLILSILIKLFIKNPLTVGGHNFFVKNAQQPSELDAFVEPFQKGHLVNVWLVMFLTELFTFLWSLLLFVPGIIKAYEYRMVPYLLAEDPSLGWRDALATSKRMMDGNKMAAFKLDLSFLGWQLLSIVTIGLAGILYVSPYMEATNAELYLTLKEQA